MRYLSLFLGLNLCFALLAAQTGAAQNNPIVDVGVFNAPISNVSRAAAPKSAEPVFNKKMFWTEVHRSQHFGRLHNHRTPARLRGSWFSPRKFIPSRYATVCGSICGDDGRYAGSYLIRGIPAGTQPQAILETRRPHSDDSGDLCTHGWIH